MDYKGIFQEIMASKPYNIGERWWRSKFKMVA